LVWSFLLTRPPFLFSLLSLLFCKQFFLILWWLLPIICALS
jgi:hypothetical protein